MEDSEEYLLNNVKKIIDIHEKSENQQGNNFNIFSILRMERKEVETHSRFIYELLNPCGLHGQGDDFLKAFVKTVLNLTEAENIRNPKREDVPDKSDAARRIDFTLESDQYLIGIEMKVDAPDLNKQMADYHQSLSKLLPRKDANSVKLFYLTLNGKRPSAKSDKGLEEGQYENISFKDDVLDWIEQCIQMSAMKSVLREALLQYKALLEKLTGIRKGVQMESAHLILRSQKNIKAALTLSESLTSAQIILQTTFWNELLHQLNSNAEGKLDDGFELYGGQKVEELVRKYYRHSKKNKNYGLRYKVKGISTNLVDDNKELYFYITVYDAVYYGFRLVSNGSVKTLPSPDKDALKNDSIFSSLSEEVWKARANDHSDWIFSKYCDTHLNFEDINPGVIALVRETGDGEETNVKVDVTEIVSDIKRLISSVENPA